MSRVIRARRSIAFGVALLGLACGDASTGPAAEESFVVSLAGISADDAGIVLRLTGSVELVATVRASLDVAWAEDDTGATTVAIVGRLSESSDALVVKRQANGEPLRVQVLEVASANGAVSPPSSVRALVRSGQEEQPTP